MANSKNNQADRVEQLILGTKKHFAVGSQTLQVAGATYTVDSLTKLMQDFVDNRDAVEVSKAATKAKIEAERAQAPSQIAVINAFKTIVRGMFGASADVLADFGLTPPKARAPVSAEKKAVAVAKRAATRAARHTASKKQKKAIKGAVTATLVVTPDTGSQPAATQPAPSAGAPPGGTPAGNAPATGTTPHAQ